MKNYSRRLLSALSAGIFLIGTAYAQTTRGTIAGIVTDTSGAVVVNATVSATSNAGGEPHSVPTGSKGEYRIEALNPGQYTLDVAAQGFEKKTVQHVDVRTSQITSANVVLPVGSTSETVSVEAGADQIQTESGELSKTIPTQDVKDLPYISLNAYALATTLPGVSKVSDRDSFTNGVAFAVNGLRPRSNNFLIDGFDNNDNGIGGQAFQPGNVEAIQEVTVLTNSYQAEFGRGGASVSNITFRSGSNKIHGAAYEQYSGSGLNAVLAEEARSGLTRPAQFVNNVYGFRIGGPAIKDKLFYFGTLQYNHNYGSQPTAIPLEIPTAAGFATLSGLAGNPNVDLLLSQVGNLRAAAGDEQLAIGTRPGCPAPCNVEFGTFTRHDRGANLGREWTARVDYNPTANDSFFVRYTDSQGSLSPDLFANPLALPTQDTFQGGPSRVVGVLWAHTFSPSVINEFRFSGQQINFSFSPTAKTLASPFANLPTYIFSSTTQAFFGGFSQGAFPQGRGHKIFQFQDAVSFNKGGHSFKLGTDLAILSVNDLVPFDSNGTITINSGGDCTAIGITDPNGCSELANFIDGFTGPGSSAISKSFGNGRLSVPTNQQAYYFQDSWKARQNLTIDYGVRYEYQPPDASNGLAFPSLDPRTFGSDPLNTRREQKPDRNNFAPRVGFAYSPHFLPSLFGNERTVLRGGYGIFYDTFFTNISDNTAATSPNSATFSQDGVTDRGLSNPQQLLMGATAAPDPFGLRETVSNRLVNPLIQQWNFNIQRELPAKLVAEVAYVGTRGERLFVNQQLNPRIPDGSGATGPRLNPQFGTTVVRTNAGDSIYHGLQTQISRNVGSLSLRAAYTYSKSLDNQSEVFATSGGASRWENTFNPRSDRGPSAFNRTHVASISYVYALPRFTNHGFLLREALGGWSTSGIVGFQTGAPETIYLGGYDQNGDGEGFNDRPSIGNPKAPINYSAACLNDTSATCITGIGLNTNGVFTDFNTGAPGAANQFRYIVFPVRSGINGNATRNNYTYPGQRTWDASVLKRFAMPWEGHEIELRADAFNVLNHPNLGLVQSSNFGNILDTANFFNLQRTKRGGRTLALWLKYQF